jgi:beta-N-acetylhexosaminidase
MACELIHKEQGENSAGAGINMNFAPVADLCHEGNGVINGLKRCYSADPDRVAEHVYRSSVAQMYYDILPTLKHFPGHGFSEGDSHAGFAEVKKSYEQLWNEDISVYAKALPRIVAQDRVNQEAWNRWRKENGLPAKPVVDRYPAIMVGHLNFCQIPELGKCDDKRNPQLPASLNPKVVTGWLREKIGHKGLIVTDDIGAMKAITDHWTSLQATILAIKAGNDQVILNNNFAQKKPFGNAQDQVKFMGDVCKAASQDAAMYQNIVASYGRIIENKRNYGIMDGGLVDPAVDELSIQQLSDASAELNRGIWNKPDTSSDETGTDT